MPKRHNEIVYLETRLARTLRQAEHSSGECGRASHEGLADLYRSQLAKLRENAEAPNQALV
ncbi:hypothetical protein ACVWZA_003122 [Sphingomonas sp. UYAg733]